jgi:tetratricopeptide (TPR) repeat protein
VGTGRMTAALVAAVLASALLAAAAPAGAVMSGAESRLAGSSDPDYAAGRAAFEREDWRGVVADLTLVVVRRPWHDNAHAMLGHAWRKLDDYGQSLAAYGTALELNPRNRAALEYLGEAYLDLGRHDDARAVLLRLAAACDQVVMAFDNQGWKSGCEELRELKLAFEARAVPLPAGAE